MKSPDSVSSGTTVKRRRSSIHVPHKVLFVCTVSPFKPSGSSSSKIKSFRVFCTKKCYLCFSKWTHPLKLVLLQKDGINSDLLWLIEKSQKTKKSKLSVSTLCWLREQSKLISRILSQAFMTWQRNEWKSRDPPECFTVTRPLSRRQDSRKPLVNKWWESCQRTSGFRLKRETPWVEEVIKWVELWAECCLPEINESIIKFYFEFDCLFI